LTSLLVDTSVLIKWFHAEGESELAQARAVRSAHVNGVLRAHILDLAVYEVGNVLVRALRWKASDIADQLDDLLTIVGPPLAMSQPWLRDASHLAQKHALSFYDACWASAASALNISLVSADRGLLRGGLAESPTAVANRLRLT
jgi:predicted nucleic acid-binding protein